MSTLVVKQVYQDDTVAQSYDRERFSSRIGRLFDALEKRTFRAVLRAALPDLPQARVLDIPCGTGRLTEVIAGEGCSCVGGDISNQMIDVARRKLARFGDQVRFQQLDLDDLALPSDAFDLVSCIRLLHHLDSPQRAAVLGALAAVTRRYVLINVSYSSPWYRLRRRIKRAIGQGVSRASSTRTEIETEAAAAGLIVRQVRFVLPGLSEDAIILLEKRPS